MRSSTLLAGVFFLISIFILFYFFYLFRGEKKGGRKERERERRELNVLLSRGHLKHIRSK